MGYSLTFCLFVYSQNKQENEDEKQSGKLILNKQTQLTKSFRTWSFKNRLNEQLRFKRISIIVVIQY
jgi:hypothetical protein